MDEMFLGEELISQIYCPFEIVGNVIYDLVNGTSEVIEDFTSETERRLA